jgi:hypothetical protein
MKTTSTPKKSILLTSLAIAAGTLLAVLPAKAVNYAGNGNSSFGGDIGNGVLSLSDDGTNINGSLVVGHGNNMYNTLVIYIDTGVGGGFTTTTNFNDQNDGNRIAISGVQTGQGRSVLTFTNGFAPQYAIALGPNTTSFGGLWQLANGGNNSLVYKSSADLSPVGTSSGPFTFSIKAADLGLTNNTPTTIKIFGTYISGSAYRSAEAIAGNDYSAFGAGWNPFTQTAYATYNFDAPPTPSYPVTFSVDMTAQVVSGAFIPNVDAVYATGTFQTNAWSGQSFQLTATVGNTNIYTGTYSDYNPTNTQENFKFDFVHTGISTNFEGVDNRPFTQQAHAQTIPLVYFDDITAIPSVTTNNVSFSIDMGPQIFLGNFNPSAGDTVQVLGTLTNPKWTIGGFVLTNAPSSSQSNIYSGTIADGNYPGSFENYKFVIHKSGGDTYENGNNRTFFTPTGSGTFPLAYFNNVFSIYMNSVTFQVNMSVPLLTGALNPGNGDTVSAAGTFQTNQWTAGAFVLTASAGNPNIYIGTYTDYNAPGTGEQFKFQINPAGNGASANYESVANRMFLLASMAQTNPVVFWNNLSTNQVLLAPTTITFTVNMSNAVDVFGYLFDPVNDNVVVNGDFLNPTWPNFWTDALLGGFDYTANLLQNNAQNLLYTGTFTVPAGSSLEVQYKYGIIHGYTGTSNTNADNEAGFGMNHTRYVRASGSYNFPTDIFGIQRTNLAAATEPPFGNLAVGALAAGHVPITWLGLPSVSLQTATNLSNPVWQTQTGTAGLSATNWPVTAPVQFFRLIQPQ